MRKSPRLASLALPVALVALLSGCLPPDPIITPVPDPTSTPVFESEEAALAAAEAAYGEYLRVTDAVFAGGGADSSPMLEVATGAQLEAELAGFKDVAASKWHSVGNTTFDQFELQQYDPASTNGAGVVVAYVCDDISAVNVLDASGQSVVSPTRPNKTYFQVTFDLALDLPPHLLVSDKSPWSDEPC